MAKNQNGYDRDEALEQEQPKDNVIGGDAALRSRLNKEFEECKTAIKYFALDWDEYEDILMVQSRSPDNLHVRVSDGSLSAITVERAGRVMAQMPTGVINSLGIKNQGQSLLMNLLWTNWIIPNANEQYDIETKFFLWDLYSNVYGTMPMMYDMTFSDVYNGPDCWLIPMRNFWPQQGRFSTKNSDFMFISTFFGREELEYIVDNNMKGYDLDCINEILIQTKDKAVAPASTNDYLRHNPMWQYRRRAQFTDTGQYEIVTKYESGADGRWISFFADYEQKIMRNIENPHDDGRIPVVLKYALPTMDSIVGLGDMEKGRFMQYGLDTVLNLQLDSQKLRTYGPRKVIMENVLMPSLRLQPAALWGVTSMEDEAPVDLGQPDSTHNLTYQFLKGALNNVLGNTTVQVSGEADSPVQGKSPAAIKQQNKDEATRDALDLKFMQKAVEELVNGMINLLCMTAKEPNFPKIELDLFDDEIKQIAQQGYQDVEDIIQWEGKTKGVPIDQAKSLYLKIPGSKLYNERGYKFRIDANSSLAQNQEEQHEQLSEVIENYIQNPVAVETLLNSGGMTLDFPEAYKQWLISGGLRQWNNILKPTATGTAPGQIGQTGGPTGGSQQATQSQNKPPSETINYKDVAGEPAGDAMLAQANLPPSTPEQAPTVQPGATPGQTPSIMTQPVSARIASIAPPQPTNVEPSYNPAYIPAHPEIRQALAHVLSRGGRR